MADRMRAAGDEKKLDSLSFPDWRVVPVSGCDMMVRPVLSTNFPSNCSKCGREIDELRCTKVDCNGCVFKCHNDPCGVVLAHVGRRANLNGGRVGQDRPVDDLAGRLEDSEGGFDCGPSADDQATGVVSLPTPDGDLSFVDFDEGANSLADAANSHCISPSEVSDPQKVTEAGEGATASPAEGCGNV